MKSTGPTAQCSVIMPLRKKANRVTMKVNCDMLGKLFSFNVDRLVNMALHGRCGVTVV